ncbi:hypothetical protein [Staphylococcus equorum]|uniref:Uncharacterized protein n=1 Tax=Staphylococcus equorum TaxID=246432 RepID=A0AAP7LUZ0_9STAP|nr:hypothetical protein [Staphylococcus equorum]OEK58937.1 hypothetical protein ASS94_01020 [Staphylococcus equorum]
MKTQLEIDTGNGDSLVKLINEMEAQKLDMVTGDTQNEEMILATLVENNEEAKLKVVIMHDNDWNHISYFNEYGECVEDFYKKDDF